MRLIILFLFLFGCQTINYPSDPQINKKIELAIKGGERLSQWTKIINQARAHSNIFQKTNITFEYSSERKIYFYNDKIVANDFDELLDELPEKIKKVIYQDQPFTTELPTSYYEFIYYYSRIMYVYEHAVRWKGMFELLDALEFRRVYDIRGYEQLIETNNLDYKVNNLDKLPEDKQLKENLLSICYTAQIDSYNVFWYSYCNKIINTDIIKYKYKDYLKQAEKVHMSVFEITPRNIKVKSVDNVTYVTAYDPGDYYLRELIKESIESKIYYKDWSLKVIFVPYNKGSKYTRFVIEKEVTPHYNSDTNIITLNQNQLDNKFNLDNIKETIAHEFGHALGLSDCYIEFYDRDLKTIVYYSLESDNMMCSAGGIFTEKSYLALKKAYNIN